MLTCKSPRKVMRVAFELARGILPRYTSKFSRHDFTLPQLFACLVVKEQQRKSYRDVEALLVDAPHWCRDIGMRKVPDHNTLCRAFHALNLQRRTGRLLDRVTQWFAIARQLGTVIAIDSSLYEPRHRSRHYEQRCRHYAKHAQGSAHGSAHASASANASANANANARRSRTARRCPKLAVVVCTRSHLICAARATTGFGSDCPDFAPLLRDARRRHPRLRTALADAGYDSEANHRIARHDLNVRSIIKAAVGRPGKRPPSGYYRRIMSKRLRGSQKGKPYGQRAQAETVNSMLKRNLGEALRSRSPKARHNEQLLRVLTHNITLLCDKIEG
jgi:hypothetical protein